MGVLCAGLQLRIDCRRLGAAGVVFACCELNRSRRDLRQGALEDLCIVTRAQAFECVKSAQLGYLGLHVIAQCTGCIEAAVKHALNLVATRQ